tara:strand:- start:115 stop:264 length:150 start_codon:yes stop_codon:yes gene_type:complete
MRLGDLIEKITTYTGIKWIVEKSTKLLGYKDCGCEKRKKSLNSIKIDRW